MDLSRRSLQIATKVTQEYTLNGVKISVKEYHDLWTFITNGLMTFQLIRNFDELDLL